MTTNMTTNMRKKYEEEMKARMCMCIGEFRNEEEPKVEREQQATATKTEEPVTEDNNYEDYKTMRFFVFPEFKNMHLLEKVRDAFPGIDLPNYGPGDAEKDLEPESVKFVNAKLFFSKEENKHKIDRILAILCEIGFTIVNRYLYKETRKLGVTTRINFDDRVILSG